MFDLYLEFLWAIIATAITLALSGAVFLFLKTLWQEWK